MLFIVSILLELAMVFEGCKGSLFESSARRNMPTILYLHFATTCLTIATNVWGTLLLLRGTCDCTEEVDWEPATALAILVWSVWVLILGVCSAVVVTFQVFPEATSRSSKRWLYRCKCIAHIFCCHLRSKLLEASTDGDEAPLDRMAGVFHKVFGHIDMTMSDVISCIFLATILQKKRRRDTLDRIARTGRTDVHMEVEPTVSGAFRDVEVGSDSGAIPIPDASLYAEPAESYACISSALGTPATHPAIHPSIACLHRTLPRRPVHPHTVQEAAHYAKFAAATYGSLLYIWTKPKATGLCTLCCGRGWCACCCLPNPREQLRRWSEVESPRATSRQALIEAPSISRRLHAQMHTSTQALADAISIGDKMNREAFIQTAGIDDVDLIYDSTKNTFLDTVPYYIALDRARQSIVLAIRGTLSMTDAVTDVMCHPMDVNKWMQANPGPSAEPPWTGSSRATPAPSPPADRQPAAPAPCGSGGGAAGWGHIGIMRVARGVIQDLVDQGLLHRLVFSVSGAPEPFGSGSMGSNEASGSSGDNDLLALQSTHHGQAARSKQRPGLKGVSGTGWRLVITGHSLGAGVAAFLGLYFRQFVSNLRVWCISPPAALMSPELAASTRDFITSVVINKDMVCRLTIKSLEKLRDEMVMAGVRCRLNKTQLLLSTFWRSMAAKGSENLDRAAGIFASADALDSDSEDILERFRTSLVRTITDEELAISRQFCLPGEIIFLRPGSAAADMRDEGGDRQYQAVWVTCRDIQAEGLLLSPHMMIEHMPDVAMFILEDTAKKLL